jgi:hypothetical protein
MDVLITENQYKTILSEYDDPSVFNPDRLYYRDKIVKDLRRGPQYMHVHIKTLPRIPITNKMGKEIIATKISHTVFNYLFGSF